MYLAGPDHVVNVNGHKGGQLFCKVWHHWQTGRDQSTLGHSFN